MTKRGAARAEGVLLGTVFEDCEGHPWVYPGSRVTSVKTTEQVFARVVPGYWPGCLWTYKATEEETLRRKFKGWGQ